VAITTLASEVANILLFARAIIEVGIFTGLGVAPLIVIGYELSTKLKTGPPATHLSRPRIGKGA